MSSTTVLNRRLHSCELAAERRATRLGRMVNDIARCGRKTRGEDVLCCCWKKRDGGHKLGVDAICVCWPRARSPMAQRMNELGRSVPLNTAVLLGDSIKAYPTPSILVGGNYPFVGADLRRSWQKAGRITLGTELGGWI